VKSSASWPFTIKLDYSDCGLLGCDTVDNFYIEDKTACSSEVLVITYMTTQCHTLEEHNLISPKLHQHEEFNLFAATIRVNQSTFIESTSLLTHCPAGQASHYPHAKSLALSMADSCIVQEGFRSLTPVCNI
jgi:hypothetical protein